MQDKMQILERKLAREIKAKEILEQEIEIKTRRLYAANEYNDTVFNSLPVAVIITDKDDTIEKVNETAKIFFPDLNIQEIQLVAKILDADLQTKGDMSTEFEINLLGRDLLVHLTKANINKQSFIYTISDITAQKKKEKKLLELQNQISESAYRDGIAENAVSVLHNIGNVLTAIINKADKTEALDQMSISNSILQKLVDTLAKFENPESLANFVTSDPRGKQLVPLLKQLSSNYQLIAKTINDYAKFTEDRCFHIGSIISTQQKHAKFKKNVVEDVNVFELIADCHKMHQDRIDKRGIKFKSKISPIATTHLEKIGFAQVISNIILNGVEAIDERTQVDPYYTEKEMMAEAIQTDAFLILKFTDNGIGADPDTLNKLFKYGFSTKNRGSGFGLHNCANFMQKSGGRIEISSDGIKKGATLTLYCPLNPEKKGN